MPAVAVETTPLVALSKPLSDWMVSAPVADIEVVPVPHTASVFAEKLVVEAFVVVSPPENVSAVEVALLGNS